MISNGGTKIKQFFLVKYRQVHYLRPPYSGGPGRWQSHLVLNKVLNGIHK
jgi:hypothetical protein